MIDAENERARARTNVEVKVEPEELSGKVLKVEDEELRLASPDLANGVDHVKHNRVRRFFRAAFKWCTEALSFRCLRRQQHTGQGAFRHYRARRGLSTLRTNELARARGPVFAPTSRISRPTSRAPLSVAGSIDEFEFTASETDQRSGADASEHRTLGLDSAHALAGVAFDAFPNDEGDEADDWNMTSARRAASEIEWYGKTQEPPTDTALKRGAWSKDEHERYCEGLERYRHGSWKLIASHVGTRTARQVISHTQSINAKRKRDEERAQAGNTPSKVRATGRSAGTSKSTRASALLLARGASVDQLNDVSSTEARKLTALELLVASMGDNQSANADLGTQATELCSQISVKTNVDSEILSCSPPLEFLLGSVVSDEELVELLDIPSNQAENPTSRNYLTC